MCSVDPEAAAAHFRFRAETPGAFMYHCGTPPVLAHIANGMYGAIVVDPEAGHADGRQELRAGLQRVVPRGRRLKAPTTLDFEKAAQMRPTS